MFSIFYHNEMKLERDRKHTSEIYKYMKTEWKVNSWESQKGNYKFNEINENENIT
jgi:hypothetical protein